MTDLNKLIDGLSKTGLLSGLAGGLAGGALTGALTSKKGRKVGKTALKVGALAAVTGLAWKAWQNYSQSTRASASAQQAGGPADRGRFEAVIAEVPYNPGPMLLVRAMIAAACADGHMDAGERRRIFDHVADLGLSAREKAILFDEVHRPLSVSDLAIQAVDTETAIEVYAASLLAIDQNQPAAQDYLQRLAQALHLPPSLVAAVHQASDPQSFAVAS